MCVPGVLAVGGGHTTGGGTADGGAAGATPIQRAVQLRPGDRPHLRGLPGLPRRAAAPHAAADVRLHLPPRHSQSPGGQQSLHRGSACETLITRFWTRAF